MQPLSVTDFLKGINEVLGGVPALVEGEVSGFAVRQERWVFFSLKDTESVVECFMPAWKLRHAVEDGMMVRVAGNASIYTKTGRFRITVEALEPAGEGALKRAFELLKQKLEREGLFNAARKRALPMYPETIGLIASGESAAYSDFLRILGNRWGGITVLHQDVRVQGDGAAADIVAALQYWEHIPKHERPGVLVLTRGGGALEDLQAFNDEAVARAIFGACIPVVVGVGHERDTTIADLVADERASTPSNAAERVVSDRHDVERVIAAMADGMADALALAVSRCRGSVDQFVLRSSAFAHDQRVVCDARLARVTAAVHAWVADAAARVSASERLMAGLHPERLLARGYSITRKHGRLVRAAGELAHGDTVETRFARGRAVSTVVETSTT